MKIKYIYFWNNFKNLIKQLTIEQMVDSSNLPIEKNASKTHIFKVKGMPKAEDQRV